MFRTVINAIVNVAQRLSGFGVKRFRLPFVSEPTLPFWTVSVPTLDLLIHRFRIYLLRFCCRYWLERCSL